MMQVEIISPYGRNSFAMSRQAVMKLLTLAFESAPDAETPAGAGEDTYKFKKDSLCDGAHRK